MAQFFLACGCVELDRIQEAQQEIKKLLDFNPEYTIPIINQRILYRVDHSRNRVLDDLRQAGLREE